MAKNKVVVPEAKAALDEFKMELLARLALTSRTATTVTSPRTRQVLSVDRLGERKCEPKRFLLDNFLASYGRLFENTHVLSAKPFLSAKKFSAHKRLRPLRAFYSRSRSPSKMVESYENSIKWGG